MSLGVGMPGSVERGNAIAAELREIAGPNVYRRNAFRVTGLPTEADAPTVRRHQQRIDAEISVGLREDTGDVRGAFDRIRGDARRRLVHELFWLWDSPDATCSCVRSLHQDHDAAVKAHSAALDREAECTAPDEIERRELDELWGAAAREWERVLRRAALWDHMRCRIEKLNERPLKDSAIDLLRAELPAFLVKSLVELAATTDDTARLADTARAWPAPPGVVDDELEHVAAPLFETVQTQLHQLADADDPDETVAAVRQEILPLLHRLDGLLPSDHSRRTASTHTDVAIVINNCANAVLSEPGPLDDTTVRELLELARDIVIDDETRGLVDQNLAGLDDLVSGLDRIGAQARELAAIGRIAMAKRFLGRLRRRMGDTPGAGALDEMLDQLETGRRLVWRTHPSAGHPQSPARSQPERRPSQRRPSPPAPPRQRPGRGPGLLRRLAAVAMAEPMAVIMMWWALSHLHHAAFGSGDSAKPATLFSERVRDNTPAGQCLATEQGWEDGRDESRVPTVRCGLPHWGEVLGYITLAPAPSKYPGDDQVVALARLQCGRMLAQQRLPGGYQVDYIVPNRAAWDDGGGKAYENYTTCVAYRADTHPIRSGRVIHPKSSVPDDVATVMDLYATAVWANAPTGSCVATRNDYDTSINSVSVVLCRQSHWAKILGYPVLYPRGTKWPGKDAVLAKSSAACERLSRSWPGGRYTVDYIWPDKQSFADPDQPPYATCLVHRTDDRAMKG